MMGKVKKNYAKRAGPKGAALKHQLQLRCAGRSDLFQETLRIGLGPGHRNDFRGGRQRKGYRDCIQKKDKRDSAEEGRLAYSLENITKISNKQPFLRMHQRPTGPGAQAFKTLRINILATIRRII